MKDLILKSSNRLIIEELTGDSIIVCQTPNLINFLDVSSNCNTNTIVCDTSKIICDELGQITEIFMPQFSLTGVIPTQIGLLTHVQVLNLYQNQLSSSICTEIGLLTKLQYLYLFQVFYSNEINFMIHDL